MGAPVVLSRAGFVLTRERGQTLKHNPGRPRPVDDGEDLHVSISAVPCVRAMPLPRTCWSAGAERSEDRLRSEGPGLPVLFAIVSPEGDASIHPGGQVRKRQR